MKLFTFVRFLKAYGLYEEFLNELKCNQGANCTNLFFCDRLKRLKPTRYISGSINWGETARGSHFWSMVSDAWVDYLNWYTLMD